MKQDIAELPYEEIKKEAVPVPVIELPSRNESI